MAMTPLVELDVGVPEIVDSADAVPNCPSSTDREMRIGSVRPT
jgi:hypothetical protein